MAAGAPATGSRCCQDGISARKYNLIGPMSKIPVKAKFEWRWLCGVARWPAGRGWLAAGVANATCSTPNFFLNFFNRSAYGGTAEVRAHLPPPALIQSLPRTRHFSGTGIESNDNSLIRALRINLYVKCLIAIEQAGRLDLCRYSNSHCNMYNR